LSRVLSHPSSLPTCGHPLLTSSSLRGPLQVKELPLGVHVYCFRVNGFLKVDQTKPVIGRGTHRRNILVVREPAGPVTFPSYRSCSTSGRTRAGSRAPQLS
jgi:hypothetical protein